jgi:hypothetical protein
VAGVVILLELALIVIVGAATAGGLRVVARIPTIATRKRRGRPRATLRTPAELARVERAVIGASSAGYLHEDLRPLLREVAAPLLRRDGIDLDVDRDPARRRLGEEVWEIVRPDRPRPADRFGVGISEPVVRRMIERLEAQ